MSHHRSIGPALLTAAIALTASRADAAVQQILSASTAVNGCQAALPAFEGVIRKRPLAVQNEGASAAFVTCARAADGFITRATVFFNSTNGQDHIINCTAVVGYLGEAQYLTRQVIAPASGVQAFIAIGPSDLGQTTDLASYYVSWSCQLPPGTGVNDLSAEWSQNIGS